MKYNEIMAAIQQLKDTVANVQCEIAALEELVANENHQEETPDETPVVNEVSNVPIIEEEVEELSAPPAEVHIDIPEDNAPDEETIIACQILSKLPDFYNGTCRSMELQKQWHDNSDKIDPKTGKNYDKLHINKYKVVITAGDIEGKPLGTTTVHWNTLTEWHSFLISRGINKHKETDNPHTNWMPKKVYLCID
jgi:hypothetical protein